MTTVRVPQGFNLNTVAIIVSFLVTLGTLEWSIAKMANKQDNFADFIQRQGEFNAKTDERFRTGGEKLAQIPINTASITRLESDSKATSDRLDRQADNFNQQLAEMRAGIGNITTDIALVKQSLTRIEAAAVANTPPREYRRVQ